MIILGVNRIYIVILAVIGIVGLTLIISGCGSSTKSSRKSSVNHGSSVRTYSVPVTPTIAVPPPLPPAPKCDSNYTGACVPVATDVDCTSGGGDGPSYVTGPVTVIGTDIYGLDGDGDGVGCEVYSPEDYYDEDYYDEDYYDEDYYDEDYYDEDYYDDDYYDEDYYYEDDYYDEDYYEDDYYYEDEYDGGGWGGMGL